MAMFMMMIVKEPKTKAMVWGHVVQTINPLISAVAKCYWPWRIMEEKSANPDCFSGVHCNSWQFEWRQLWQTEYRQHMLTRSGSCQFGRHRWPLDGAQMAQRCQQNHTKPKHAKAIATSWGSVPASKSYIHYSNDHVMTMLSKHWHPKLSRQAHPISCGAGQPRPSSPGVTDRRRPEVCGTKGMFGAWTEYNSYTSCNMLKKIYLTMSNDIYNHI